MHFILFYTISGIKYDFYRFYRWFEINYNALILWLDLVFLFLYKIQKDSNQK